MKKNTDVSESLKRKQTHRRELAALPYEKKVEMVVRVMARSDFMKPGIAAASKPQKTKARRG